MVSQHSVEQTIHGAQARLYLTTAVDQLWVSYRTENIPLLRCEGHWHPTCPHGPYNRASCHTARKSLSRSTGNPSGPNSPTSNRITSSKSYWRRNLCENKAVAILEQMQAGKPALIKKDGGEMLIAIVLFFRPTPSWLSPGRSTCFIACCKMGLID